MEIIFYKCFQRVQENRILLVIVRIFFFLYKLKVFFSINIAIFVVFEWTPCLIVFLHRENSDSI